MHNPEDTNCEIYRDMLYDYVSDNLSEQDRADFLMHINSCPDCKCELSELELILGATAEIEDVDVPDSVRTAVSAALAKESVKIRNRKKIYKFTASTILPIAACAALAIGIYSGGIYDGLNNADRMITDVPVVSQPESNLTDEESSQNTQITAEVNPEDKGAMQKNDNTTLPKQSDSSSKSSSSAKNPKVADSTSSHSTIQLDEPSVDVVLEENIPSTSTEEIPSSVSTEEVEEPVAPPVGRSGGGSSSPMLKSAMPPNVADEEHLPETASEASIEDSATFSLPAPCEETEVCDNEEDLDRNKNSTATGHCTVVVPDPTDFANGFGINESGNSITFTIPAEQWIEFVNYCRSYGASVNADFPATKYHSVTVTITQGR